MAYSILAASISIFLGLALAEFNVWSHVMLAGYYAGLLFPMSVYINFYTAAASGAPRPPREYIPLLLALILATAAPIPGSTIMLAMLFLLSQVALLYYMALQAEKIRRNTLTRIAALAPPVSGILASLALLYSDVSSLFEAIMILVLAFSTPVPLLMAPTAVGASIYGLGPVQGRESIIRLSPALLAVAASIPTVFTMSVKPYLIPLLIYLFVMRPWRPASSLLKPGLKAPQAYLLSVHIATLAAIATILFIAGDRDIVEAGHAIMIGVIAPHALLHSLVRGGEIPFTRRPRSWTPIPPLLLAASTPLRLVSREASLALALLALAVHAASLLDPHPKNIVPRAFRVERRAASPVVLGE
ncbi:hypothetical protein [Aeropyrum camini]|uniref:Uncharacterized protein n=1 Tax=Aeropyrum camini SY1 = JCM 12091 TaxID=1198449 RepID=U3TH35_9CREN|nr:hypothetical protein [Aeropyrum camini]BAN90624.1 hypothetical protein ACAM_1155 [Aeropyrum camini SY1 = JCM 12091]